MGWSMILLKGNYDFSHVLRELKFVGGHIAQTECDEQDADAATGHEYGCNHG